MMGNEAPPPPLEHDPAFDGVIHGTTVTIDGRAVIIRGRSGTGKSDLALRLIDRGAKLLSDDYTHVVEQKGKVIATPPPAIAGLAEVRGIGIICLPHESDAAVELVVILTEPGDPPPERCPTEQATVPLCGMPIPLLILHGFESSAPIKIELALKLLLGEIQRSEAE